MSNNSGIFNRFSGKGVYPHQLAWILLLPFRNFYLSPRKLIKRMNLRQDCVVLELGCGPGYFSPFVAQAIPDGKLFLTDIQPEMLAKAEMRLKKKNISNVELIFCDGQSLPFEDNFFNCIYLVTVLGEIVEKETYTKEMYRILKPGGVLSISEQGGDPDSLQLDVVKDIFLPAGFVFDRVFGKSKTFTANFIRP